MTLLEKLDACSALIVEAMAEAGTPRLTHLIQMYFDLAVIRRTAEDGNENTAKSMARILHAEYEEKLKLS